MPFLKSSQLAGFLEILRQFGTVHGPTISEQGVVSFAPIPADQPEMLRLDYQRTLIPPKKFLLPFRERILTHHYHIYRQPEPLADPVVLVGVHPCDLRGIAYLDRVFLADRPDPSYAAKRSRLTLVGLSCEPDDYCFCSASGEASEEHYDIFLEQGTGGLSVRAAGEKGLAILKAASPLLSDAEFSPRELLPPYPLQAQDPELRFSLSPLWEKYAAICVSCGACSACCPTCYCYDVREYQQLGPEGMRLREWDNCFFKTHGEVAGGNFRPTRLERLRYRFLHKFCGFSPLQGVLSCVGCGRCKAACPVEIDLRELTDLYLNQPPEETAKPT